MTPPLPYRLTVEDSFRLADAGAFEGLGKTELIRGEAFYINAQLRPHARLKGQIHLLLASALGELDNGLDVLIEATVAMSPNSAPEPDLIVTSEPDGEGPVPIASVRLLIEIADSTQKNDLETKAGLYAENGVPEYWVADLRARVLHRMASPTGGKYGETGIVAFGQRVEAATIEGLAIDLPGGT